MRKVLINPMMAQRAVALSEKLQKDLSEKLGNHRLLLLYLLLFIMMYSGGSLTELRNVFHSEAKKEENMGQPGQSEDAEEDAEGFNEEGGKAYEADERGREEEVSKRKKYVGKVARRGHSTKTLVWFK